MSTATTGNGVDFTELENLLDIDSKIKELKAEVSQLAAERSQLEELLTEQFALAGVQSLNVRGQTCYRHVDKYINAKAEHRAELVAWARENELDEMIVLQPARFKSWCKEQLEDDASGIPPAILDKLNIGEKVSLRVRRS